MVGLDAAFDAGLVHGAGAVTDDSGRDQAVRFSPEGYDFKEIKHITLDAGSSELIVNKRVRMDRQL